MAASRRPPAVGAAAHMRQAIQRAGYYPDLLADTLDEAMVDEPVVEHLVHHETHFEGDELRRHASVLALTATRLVLVHADEYPADEGHPDPYVLASSESIPLSRVGTISVTRTVTRPDTYRSGEPAGEIVLSFGWSGVARLELAPAQCGDPDCEADHGYTGVISGDDFSVRVNEGVDGREAVAGVLAFATALSRATVALATR